MIQENAQSKDDLLIQITGELASTYERIYHRPLPGLLTTHELTTVGARTKAALDFDACHGTGLIPLPNQGKGKPRRYLLSQVVRFLAGVKNAT